MVSVQPQLRFQRGDFLFLERECLSQNTVKWVESGGRDSTCTGQHVGKNQVVSESIVYFQAHNNLQVGFLTASPKMAGTAAKCPETGGGWGACNCISLSGFTCAERQLKISNVAFSEGSHYVFFYYQICMSTCVCVCVSMRARTRTYVPVF